MPQTGPHMSKYPVEKTDAEWRQILTPEQYAGTARTRDRAAGYMRAAARASSWGVHVRGVRPDALRRRPQVRKRHRLAELLRAARGIHRHHHRSRLRHDAHGSALQPLRRPSRSRLRGRPAADGTAVLHQRHRVEFRTPIRRARLQSRQRAAELTFGPTVDSTSRDADDGHASRQRVDVGECGHVVAVGGAVGRGFSRAFFSLSSVVCRP